MKNQENAKNIYILFADIKGYSANKKNLDLIAQIEDLLYGYGEKYFGNHQENCFKVLGDGMLGTSYDCEKIANAALEIVADLKAKEKNGDFKNFTEIPKIRIALHIGKKGKIREKRLENDIFKDVAGEAIIQTARIEPIVMPNEVFCSNDFATILESTNIENVQTTELGNFELGKAHDSFKIDLFVLHNQNEEKDVEVLVKHINEKINKPEPCSKLAESIYYFNAINNYNYSFTDNSVDNSREIKADNYFEKIETISIDQRKQK